MVDIVNRAHQNPSGRNSRKPWKWMVIDSAIIGGIAVFATIGSMLPTWETAWVAFKAFGAAFLIQLAVERGLKRRPE